MTQNTVLRLRDGRLIESAPVPVSAPRALVSHLALAESLGLSFGDVEATGWRVDGELDWGGGGTLGRGSFTLEEYEATRLVNTLLRETENLNVRTLGGSK